MLGRSLQDRLWPAVVGAWLLALALSAYSWGKRIPHLLFPDPDDAMRLMQVRDWLAGQSWWDVAQHRLNGGDFPMHWSRLVDLPIAATLLVFDPLVGPALADRVAGAIVPAATLLVILALCAALTRRLAGPEAARLAVLVVPLAIPILIQVQPMRLDHHAWQIACAVAALIPLAGRADARNGALSGLALATLLTISLEGLPFTVAAAGVAALAWAFEPARRAFLLAQLWTLAGAAALMHGATRGPGFMLSACDAVSPVWLAALAAAAAGVAVATRLPAPDMRWRVGALVPAALASAAVLLLIEPRCASGPFATLPPLVRDLWYDSVREGLPVWRQLPVVAAATLGLPLFGIVGTWLAWRDAAAERRPAWAITLAVLVAATIVAATVIRAGGVANAVATPGAAVLLLRLLRRARAIGSLVPRVVATAGALLLASPGVAFAALASLGGAAEEAAPADGPEPCTEFADIRAVRALPPSVVFAPIDVTPDMLATSAHRGISGGYHRNADAIHFVFRTFTAPPESAREMVEGTGAAYVAGCPGLNETELYKYVAPNGLWARLERGDAPDWLRPVRLPGSPVRVWRVIRR
ncbi:hypothetical protein [Sphingomonas lenta]|uniref:AcrB/AcrD/AcrF family protein n=1 Tax=Sphingomonas lenta TaxID=1141887 RepID=A0A2A2SEG0_9SPHN|nr:hypothetical protein [Sphingomonas lenta]PAX07585.1 hypothetical protein CKY28_07990 [Sphingomonas lenta]